MNVDRLLQKVMMIVILVVTSGFSSETLNAMQESQKEVQKFAATEIYKMSVEDLNNKFYKTEIEKEINVQIENETLPGALSHIANETGLKLTYRGEIIRGKNITLIEKNISVSDALDSILEGTGFDYKFSEDGYLLISEIKEDIQKVIYQDIVRGQVIDFQTGQSLPGVNILVEGTNTGTNTDENGNFELQVQNLQATLVFSYIGYESLEVPIDGRSEINVQLTPSVIAGEELVVVGYGTQRVQDLTGSVSRVNARDIQQVPVATVNQALQGRSSGVMVTQGNSEPGQDARVRIRGFNSLQGNNSPLYVIDGVIDANINTVNPTDIESITVLKDAAASSIYGARGANGVIIVQTREGLRQQDVQVDFNHFSSVDVPGRTHDLMNAQEFMEYSNAVASSNNTQTPYPDINSVLNQVGDGFDWQNSLYETGVRHKTNMSISGGTESISYFISGAYENHTAVLPEKGFERMNARARIDAQPTERLRLSGNLSYVKRERDRSYVGSSSWADVTGRGGIINRTVYNPPVLNPYNEDGSLRSTMTNTYNQAGSALYGNGLIAVDELNIVRNNDIQLTFEGQYDILESLNYRISYSTSPSLSESRAFRPSYVPGTFQELESTASRSYSESSNQTVENLLAYTETFQNHNVSGLVGTTYQQRKSESFGGGAARFPFDSFLYHNLGTGDTDTRNISSGYSESTWLGYFGRLDYEYDGRYLIQLNGRYDGSSFFQPENRWAFFPSGAIGWVISGENFMQNSGIDFLKLRASYGSIGSNATGPYTTLPQVNVSGGDDYSFGGERIQNFVMSLANPELKWETTTQFNVGADLGLIDNRLNITLDYYQKETTDLILSRLTSIVNATLRDHEPSILSNLGSMKNSGVEFNVDYNQVFNSGLSWNMNFNVSYQTNEILNLALPEGQTFFTYGDNLHRNVSRVEEGQPLGNYNGWLTDGLFQNQSEIDGSAQPDAQPGDVRFVDINDDGIINEADWTVTGNAYPDYYGGLSSSFFYKGFELDFVLSGAFGHEMANVSAAVLKYDLGSTLWNKSREVVEGSWTGPGSSNDIPRIGNSVLPAGTDNGINGTVDLYVEDASFVKLRNVRLAYNISNFLGADNLRLYIQGQNLFVITSYSGYDPETDNFALRESDDLSLALDSFTYPFMRSYSIGMNVSF